MFAKLLGLALFAGAVFVRPAVAAVPEKWKDCAPEIAKYCPKAASDDAIFACLEAREAKGVHGGLSKQCDAAHEKFETPAQEKSEAPDRGTPKE